MNTSPEHGPHPLTRRDLLATAVAWTTATASPSAAPAGPGPASALRALRSEAALALTWRGPAPDDPHHAGVVEVSPAPGSHARLRWTHRLPSRAHGLARIGSADLLVVAMRPGRWLLRLAEDGRALRLLNLDDEPDGHRLDGHAVRSDEGRVLFTPQTDRAGRGWVAVRDASTLALLDRWPAHGIDPHQAVLDPDGHLLVALGGIRRTPDGRKTDLDRMASALVQLHGRTGALLGRWTLPDARLSLRHLAWARPAAGGAPRLGVALQAEHDDPADREAAPLLALWDGHSLQTALQAARHAGYAGDIAPAGASGFALSAQPAGRGLIWQPGPPPLEQVFAELREPCALASDAAGAIWMAAAAGLARWHPTEPPQLWRWPEPMVPDNHALML